MKNLLNTLDEDEDSRRKSELTGRIINRNYLIYETDKK